MSMMGKLSFFLGLQIKETFISQEKYIRDFLKKYQMMDVKPIDTPMGTSSKFDSDEPGPKVSETMYRGIIW